MLPSEFLKELIPQAQQAQISTGISVGAICAQAILESRWGRSRLANDAHNLFGIKADKSWIGPTVKIMTAEHSDVDGWYNVMADWRSYPDWEASIIDHSKFFFDNPRYKPALAVRDDAEAFCHQLQECGYATDPDYAIKLIQIMRGRNLQKNDVPKSQWKLLSWASV